MSDSAGSHQGSSNSASSILSTLIPTFVVAAIVFTAFLILRPKFSRVYRPRTLDYVIPYEYVFYPPLLTSADFYQ